MNGTTIGTRDSATWAICGRQARGRDDDGFKRIEKGRIIITTPQQWDVISRRWKQRKNVQTVSLFIADELQLIGGSMGPTIEVESSLAAVHVESTRQARARAQSVHVAGERGLGEWIGASSPAVCSTAPGVRPVPLEIHFQGVDIINFEARMQAMARPTYGAIANRCRRSGPPSCLFPLSLRQIGVRSISSPLPRRRRTGQVCASRGKRFGTYLKTPSHRQLRATRVGARRRSRTRGDARGRAQGD